MNPRVIAVTPTRDHKLELRFANGEMGIYDCAPLLGFGVFQELRDWNYFQQASAQAGTVVWPHQQDICPDTLYEDSEKIAVSRSTPSTALPAQGSSVATSAAAKS